MKTYIQLPLDGGQNDFSKAYDELNSIVDFERAVDEFFKANENINPRQLFYIAQAIINGKHLDVLIDWKA